MSDRFSMAILSYVIHCRKAIKSSQFAKYQETAGPQNLSDLVIDTFSIIFNQKGLAIPVSFQKLFFLRWSHLLRVYFVTKVTTRLWTFEVPHSALIIYCSTVGFFLEYLMRLPTWLKNWARSRLPECISRLLCCLGLSIDHRSWRHYGNPVS